MKHGKDKTQANHGPRFLLLNETVLGCPCLSLYSSLGKESKEEAQVSLMKKGNRSLLLSAALAIRLPSLALTEGKIKQGQANPGGRTRKEEI